MKDALVWIDCEMTGLDLSRDALIEVAVLVTDANLNVLGDGVDLIIHAPETLLNGMDEVVTTMHAKSGLLEAVRASSTTLEQAEQQVLDYVRAWVREPRTAPLAGNTVSTDRAFLARDLPALERHLHYRNVDVSSIKELARRWYPPAYHHAPTKQGNHRALADIIESIAELRYYRASVFVPAPGPSNREAKAIAATLSAAGHADAR